MACWLGVGTSNPSNQQCGDATANRLFLSTQASLVVVTTPSSPISFNPPYPVSIDYTVNNAGGFTISGFPIASFSVARYNATGGSLDNMVATLTSLGIQSGASGTITNAYTVYVQPSITVAASNTLTITNLHGIYVQAFATANGAGFTVQNYYAIRIGPTSGGFSASATNVGLYLPGIMVGGTANYFIWSKSDIAGSGAGWCSGTAADTCIWRGSAGVWALQNPAASGVSLWVSKYLAVGATAAPSNTAAGAFSTTKVTPALQAFGAVTANAASGVLAFTVSTAAASCGTAVVTNTNVVAGSEVILTIQSYSGVQFTNGRPSVSRSDTAGSSAGSFTLQLCNDHTTNALSGNLYVAFWVLN